MNFVMSLADRLVVLDFGVKISEGAPEGAAAPGHEKGGGGVVVVRATSGILHVVVSGGPRQRRPAGNQTGQ